MAAWCVTSVDDVVSYIIGLCHLNGYIMISFDVIDLILGCDIIRTFCGNKRAPSLSEQETFPNLGRGKSSSLIHFWVHIGFV